jgi:hypothetical protein
VQSSKFFSLPPFSCPLFCRDRHSQVEAVPVWSDEAGLAAPQDDPVTQTA